MITVARTTVQDLVEDIVRTNDGPAYLAPRAPEHLRVATLRALALTLTFEGDLCPHLRKLPGLLPSCAWSWWPERVMCSECADAIDLGPDGDYPCHECGEPADGYAVTVTIMHVAWTAALCREHIEPHAHARLPAPRT